MLKLFVGVVELGEDIFGNDQRCDIEFPFAKKQPWLDIEMFFKGIFTFCVEASVVYLLKACTTPLFFLAVVSLVAFQLAAGSPCKSGLQA